MKSNLLFKLAVASLALPALTNPVLADEEDGDGAPHVAIVDDGAGNLELEFEIPFGLDETGITPVINLVAPEFVLGGYVTAPVNDTVIPNDDLGFVSELEGGSEGGAIGGDIIIRLLSKDSNFAAFFPAGVEILTTTNPDFALGSAFDTHPVWVLANAEGDFTPASASFEVFDVSGQSEVSLGQFDVNLSVPEPGSAVALLLGAGLIASRRRRK